MITDKPSRVLVPASRVKQRCGVASDMTLRRWLHDEDLAFPRPVYINGRRYWYEDELQTWEQSRASTRDGEPVCPDSFPTAHPDEGEAP